MSEDARGSSPRFLKLVALTATACVSGFSFLDPDLPWHLSAARHLWETRRFIDGDFLSWTLAGKPWIDFEWASGLLFLGLDRLGGTSLLWAFRAALLWGVVALHLELLKLWRVPERWRWFSTPVLAASISPLAGIRPELFSLALFMAQLVWLERRRLSGSGHHVSPGAAAAHAAVYAVWANLHAGFVTGLLLCAAYGVGELYLRPREAPGPWLAGLSGLAGSMANPYGPRILQVIAEHGRELPALRSLIEEWKPPDPHLGYLTGYWLLAAFAFAGLWAAWRQGVELPPQQLALIALLVPFGAGSIRMTKYLILALFPLGVTSWASLSTSLWTRRALAVAAVAAVPFLTWRGFSRAGDRAVFGRPPALEVQGPGRAISYLREEKATLSGLRLYNPYNWGGALGYALFPDYRVFIDGRYIFLDLLAEVDRAQRSPDGFRGFIDALGVGVAIQENDGLMLRNVADALPESPRPYSVFAWPRATWALVYWDSRALIYVRRDKVPAAWLSGREYRWLRPHDYRHLGLLLVAGQVPVEEVAEEISRYRREVGDEKEVAALDAWFSGLRLAPSVGRTRS